MCSKEIHITVFAKRSDCTKVSFIIMEVLRADTSNQMRNAWLNDVWATGEIYNESQIGIPNTRNKVQHFNRLGGGKYLAVICVRWNYDNIAKLISQIQREVISDRSAAKDSTLFQCHSDMFSTPLNMTVITNRRKTFTKFYASPPPSAAAHHVWRVTQKQNFASIDFIASGATPSFCRRSGWAKFSMTAEVT